MDFSFLWCFVSRCSYIWSGIFYSNIKMMASFFTSKAWFCIQWLLPIYAFIFFHKSMGRRIAFKAAIWVCIYHFSSHKFSWSHITSSFSIWSIKIRSPFIFIVFKAWCLIEWLFVPINAIPWIISFILTIGIFSILFISNKKIIFDLLIFLFLQFFFLFFLFLFLGLFSVIFIIDSVSPIFGCNFRFDAVAKAFCSEYVFIKKSTI